MDSRKLNAWLGIVANVSVIAGIVFLAFELRQTSDAIRANTVQSMSAEQSDFNLVFTDPEMSRIVTKAEIDGYESLDPVEKNQLQGLNNSFFYTQQNLHYQYLNGNLEPEIWQSRHRAVVDLFKSDQIRIYWSKRGFVFNDNFRRYIDGTVIPEATRESASP